MNSIEDLLAIYESVLKVLKYSTLQIYVSVSFNLLNIVEV